MPVSSPSSKIHQVVAGDGQQQARDDQECDGSCDVYFGPKAPKGQENNWVRTVPGKGWSTTFRLYGPLEPWYNKTWRLGEIELVK
jgi:hypothetical protein